MVIISFKSIREFASIHSDVKEALKEWYTKTAQAEWKNLTDVKQTFNSVDYVGNDRYVFNIKGNRYRLVAMIFFNVRTVYIRFIGTHSDYEQIDVSTV
jgi:mRNA interferase HigB